MDKYDESAELTGLAFARSQNCAGPDELTVTITLAEYRELVRVSTLYEQEHPLVKRPLSYESIGEVE